ncbi:uncharacterized protein LOC143888272 isoform X2 [Tasmannia lanceolata]|uniref:uncharacterized protein LOC143888272 isoform X2 n=1 Tax=Tasmannia lanceolata TaxID=3420 RepID=UPI004062AD3B
MSRYVNGSFLFFFFFFFFLSFPVVFSQLSPNQTDIITRLVSNLNISHMNPNPCSWKGIRCSGNSITNISFSGFGISDSNFLVGLCQLDSLQSIDLSNNLFTSLPESFISDCGSINGLKMLNLGKNILSGLLPVFRGFGGLEFLDLSFNNFSGNVTFQLDGLVQLRSLNLSSNSFFGTVPTHLGKGMVLEELHLSNNLFQGPISEELMNYTNLILLDLSFNNIYESVPDKIGELSKLEILILSSNRLTGVIPQSLSRINTLSRFAANRNMFTGLIPRGISGYLRSLDLSYNYLTGSIPPYFLSSPNLQVVDLTANSLLGTIPVNISRNLFRLRLSSNNFTGSIPQGISRYLQSLDLSYNNLTGSIPSDFLSSPNLQVVDLTANSLVGAIPVNISRNMFRLRLSFNSLNGPIPSVIGELFNLAYLEVESNWLTGEIPLELVNCLSLTLLNLAQNQLQGTIPAGLGKLKKLAVVKLNRNHLNGVIPVEISQLQNLLQLNLSQNSFTGSIPSAIGNLTQLLNLNLGGNELSGSIPQTIANMAALLELQLGGNNLSGEIPRMPDGLQIALNLSSNHFNGSIPNNLGSLNGLELLDLSNNGFTGVVPASFSQLVSLTQLDLSNNQLSGTLPRLPPRAVINISGNKGLVALSPDSPPQDSRPNIVSRKKRIPTAVVIFVKISDAFLAIVFVAVILILVSRYFYRVNDEHLPSGEQPPDVISGHHLITIHSIHRSSIDFTRAMEVFTTNIMLNNRFSTYNKVTMPCGMSYYVKKLNCSDSVFQLGSHERLRQALEILGRLSNSKVMTPLAYALTADSAYLFYEYAQKGTLFDFLHRSSGDVLDWPCRYSIALGVAQGLDFLHGCTDPVLLLDLSTKTILLKSLNEPQIADIELYKVIDPSTSTGSLSKVAGSVGYIPPEYAYTIKVTVAANVYSYGVVLLELLTGKPPISEGTELAKWVLSHPAQDDGWEHILDSSVSQTSPEVRSQMLSMLKVAQACISISPEARPMMKNVIKEEHE